MLHIHRKVPLHTLQLELSFINNKMFYFKIKSTKMNLVRQNCYIIKVSRTAVYANRPYPVIWKTVPIRINILKLHQVNFCIENITLSKLQGDTRNSFPDIAFRIYINSYEKLGICTWVGTKYCILPTLSQRVLYLKTL